MRWLTGFLCLFFASPSFGAITLVQKVISDACSVTISANTSGNLLAVGCESQSSTLPASVTDNASGGSNTYTEVVGSRGGLSGGVAATNIFYSQTTHAGATTVTCAGSCYGAAVYEYSGALASGNPVDTSSGTVSITCSSGLCTGAQVTTTDAGDVIFSYIAPFNSILSVAAPYTDFLGATSNGQASCDYIPGSTVTNSAAVWTSSVSGDITGTSVAAFLPAAGGGGSATPFIRRVITSE